MSSVPIMNVLFVASEATPFVKVGGLADVAGSLPIALKKLQSSTDPHQIELDIRLVIPFHPIIQTESLGLIKITEFSIQTLSDEIRVQAYNFKYKGVPVYLIETPTIKTETAVYSADLEADGYKYVSFSIAVLELAKNLGWKFNILHANDWHTAAAVYALALKRSTDPFFHQAASLLTIHNLPFLGSMTSSALKEFGLPAANNSALPVWAQHMALPLGLLASDYIVAVSPEYAREILSVEFGSGLQSFLKTRQGVISGILNGLDTEKWEPSADAVLVQNYSDIDLSAKYINKTSLQENLGLEINPRIPVMAMVTRMDPQKGVDLAVDALRGLLQSPADLLSPFQMVFLGMGNTALEDEVRRLEKDFPQQVRARIMFDERLSHNIYAGADMLLMPSRYEPCGLSQMIAMRYGCVPIARATGGLSDTIIDAEEQDQSTGFLFKSTDPVVLSHAIQRALQLYIEDPITWQAIQVRGMQQDFSWDRSAKEYLKKYQLLLGKRKKV
jgi:starch synthase